ncbi:MAG: hypothetical protein ABIR34_05535 [Marmoricola sp.]
MLGGREWRGEFAEAQHGASPQQSDQTQGGQRLTQLVRGGGQPSSFTALPGVSRDAMRRGR